MEKRHEPQNKNYTAQSKNYGAAQKNKTENFCSKLGGSFDISKQNNPPRLVFCAIRKSRSSRVAVFGSFAITTISF